jgi:hypothetical protein
MSHTICLDVFNVAWIVQVREFYSTPLMGANAPFGK